MTDSSTTKDRLLTSAVEVFAERGYRDATIAEICDRAGANIAMVNYYFGDKRSLYTEVWRGAFACARDVFPLDGGLGDGSSAETKLRAFIHAILGRAFSEGAPAQFARIMHREVSQPSEEVDRIVDEALRPQVDRIRSVLREFLGEGVGPRVLNLCLLSIVGQCHFPGMTWPVRKCLMGREGVGLLVDDLGELAEHITCFSIAGLRAVREREESKA